MIAHSLVSARSERAWPRHKPRKNSTEVPAIAVCWFGLPDRPESFPEAVRRNGSRGCQLAPMNGRSFMRRVLRAAMAALLMAMAVPAMAQELTPVRFIHEWRFEGHVSPFLVALDK